MYKIFFIPESRYIQSFYRYQLHNQRWFSIPVPDGQFIIIPSRSTIVPSIKSPYDKEHQNYVWVKDDLTLPSFDKLKEFINLWFIKNMFCGTITDGSSKEDIDTSWKQLTNSAFALPPVPLASIQAHDFDSYANPYLYYSNECFEIHDIINNKIRGTAEIKVCLQTKRIT
ncbi:MAG: hypothetical protein ACYDEX_24745 [Mobilitalea sp.]